MKNVKKIFYKWYSGVEYYRIPSLITTEKGTLISAIDMGHGDDRGKIRTAVRRSTDGGKSWLPMQVLVDLPEGAHTDEFYCAMTIDPIILQDRQTGRVFIFTCMYPESHAAMNHRILEASNGYKRVGDKQYFILRDHYGKVDEPLSYNREYTVREGGVVYDGEGNSTEYTLPDITNGTLYKSGEPCGSVMLYTGENAAPLSMVRTGYCWLLYSDDEGESWSKPIDITPMVKPENEKGMGPGPGAGLQSSSGRLLFPYWRTATLSTGTLYSDDHGSTWKAGKMLIEGGLDRRTSESQVIEVTDRNGDKVLKLFVRAYPNVLIATSKDDGESWDGFCYDEELLNPDNQVSVVRYPYTVKGLEGKQVVLYSGANSTNRRYNGTVHLGYYEPETDRFVWVANRIINSASFMYSCLSVIAEDRVGIVYETRTAFGTRSGTGDISYAELKVSDFKIEL